MLVLVVTACGPTDPCSGYQFKRLDRFSRPYAGHWVVAHGDTLTFPDSPQMSDRFRLAAVVLGLCGLFSLRTRRDAVEPDETSSGTAGEGARHA